MARLNFGVLDYILFCFILVVPITIAVVVRCTGGKQKTTSEYLVGNGHMSVVPVGISLGISFISAITILGYPAESYFFGVTVSFINVGIVISLVITTMILVPVYHPLQLTSPNQVSLPPSPRQTRHASPMFGQWWSDIVGGGPTLTRHWFNVPCLP